MNKTFKKYGKRKWMSIRLSRKYKSRQALKMMNIAQTVACAKSYISTVAHSLANTKNENITKKIAMAKCISDAIISINNELGK